MWALVLVVLAVVLFGAGFALKVLWYAAVVAVLLAIISFAMGRRVV